MNVYSLVKQYFASKIVLKQNADEYFTYVAMTVLCVFAIAPHAFLAVYFYNLDIYPLAVCNFVSCLWYVFCYWLLRKGKYKSVIMAISGEIVANVLITVALVGTGTYVQFYILLLVIAQFSVVRFWKWQRFAMVIFLYFCFLSTFYLGSLITPIYSITNNRLLEIFNITVVFTASILELSMDKFVNGIIDSQQQKNIEELKLQAHIDPLTGLYNRRYANIYFESIIKNLSSYNDICFAMVDIDNFKSINDTYGHSTGDKVLINLAEIFQHSLRQTDRIIRWGGEEFLLVITNADIDVVFRIIDNIRRRIEESETVVDGHTIKFTVTAGAAQLKDTNIERTIKNCDNNLYEGKRSGKNKVVV